MKCKLYVAECYVNRKKVSCTECLLGQILDEVIEIKRKVNKHEPR